MTPVITLLTRLSPRRRNGNIQRPNLPANLFLPIPSKATKPHPRAPAFLFIELHSDAPPYTPAPTRLPILRTSGRGEMLADEGLYTGLDESFKVCVIDSGEGEVEYIKGDGPDRGEVAVEEDEV